MVLYANAWDSINTVLVDKIISATSFNEEQIRLISDALRSSYRILDLCIGFGNLAKILTEQGKNVYGIDISARSLEYAGRKVGDSLHLVQGDVKKLEYDSEFDGVSCASSFGFPDLDPITNGVYRALRPKGYFALTGLESSRVQEHTMIMKKELERKIKNGALRFTPDETEELKEIAKIFDLRPDDSSQRVGDSLTRNDFQIIERKPFYYDTCYFILAQRN